MNLTPVVIPSYEPDFRLLDLIKDLLDSASGDNIIVVDDGSDDSYCQIFALIEDLIAPRGGVLLRHEIIRGKGAALKTAFAYVLGEWSEVVGVVTADSDGQHTPACINRVASVLAENPDSLVLGTRVFDWGEVPWKSYFGNKITSQVMRLACGKYISDTQTGLRGIPIEFMRELVNVPGDRFEFETRMLLASGDRAIVEVPIETVYDSIECHQTHFNPFMDSLRIYRILLGRFFKYAVASLSSCILDFMLFWIFGNVIKTVGISEYAFLSTVLARVCSATFNYCLNSRLVFETNKRDAVSGPRYFGLAAAQMIASGVLVSAGVNLFQSAPDLLIKATVDGLLFFVSYWIQMMFVF